MQHRRVNRFALLFACVIVMWMPAPGQGQVPADLEIIAAAGGIEPAMENHYVRILANGQGEYARYLADAVGQPNLVSNNFMLEATALASLWQAIQSNDFFGLNPLYTTPDSLRRSYARLIIHANGTTHEVITRDIAVERFDNIMAAINQATPPENDLIYDTSPRVTIVPRVLCPAAGDSGTALALPQWRELLARKGHPAITGARQQPGAVARPADDEFSHPGTVLANTLSLRDAINCGLATLEGKGGFFGDQVSIRVDNRESKPCKKNLTLTLHLEFYGPAATPANVARIKAAIEAKWNGFKTSSGDPLKVVVDARRTMNATPPGTPGYHQIKLVADKNLVSYCDEVATINSGVTGGTWSTLESDLDAVVAHEAGHLMGLKDRYDEFLKQTDGTWEKTEDGTTLTNNELADLIKPSQPGLSLTDVRNWLAKPSTQRAATLHPGHENNIMARRDGKVEQRDIDFFTSHPAGVLVQVRPGDILLNKNRLGQNLALLRYDNIFAPAGSVRTLHGLYAACIDLDNGSPASDDRFDVAPPLETWTGIAAAAPLLTLLQYLDERELFCDDDLFWQLVIWRLTNNANLDNPEIQAFLDSAGVRVGTAVLDFPKMYTPNAEDTASAAVIPPELFVARTSPATALISPGENLTLSGRLGYPALEGSTITSEFAWQLDRPAGSSAQLTNSGGPTATLLSDVRGYYLVSLNVSGTMTGEANVPFNSVFQSRIVAADARTETFESGTLQNSPFLWQNSAELPWSLSQATAHTGAFALQAAVVDSNQTSTIAVSCSLAQPGTIAFAYKISTLEYLSSLRFLVDGVELGRWAGKIDWSRAEFALPAGSHTLAWSFVGSEFGSLGGFETVWIDDILFPQDAIFTSVATQPRGLPFGYSLAQNHPNPALPLTTFSFTLPRPELVTLRVYDVLGKEVAVLLKDFKPAGRHQLQFDMRHLPAGIYFYQLTAGQFKAVRKMMLLH